LHHIVSIGADQITNIEALQSSQVVRDVLGDVLVDAMVAVRGHEAEIAKEETMDALVEKFRYAWSA
jgi:glutamine synthetase